MKGLFDNAMNVCEQLKIFVAMLVLAGGAFSAELAEIDTSGAVRTAEEAVERAYRYTGFQEIKSVPQTAAAGMASCMTLPEDNTPFLNDSVTGRPVWIVQLNDVRISSPNWLSSWIDRYNPKSYTAVIDSATGRLFKIYSTAEVEDPDLAPEPPADIAAVKLKTTGEEYLGFPSQPPLVTFSQALAQASGSDPLRAKEILAVCVIESDKFVDGGEPRVVWCITGRGIEPLDIHPTKAPLYMRNRRRTIIDATTGGLIGITTSPSVEVRQPSDNDPGGANGVAPKDSAKEW